MFMHDSSVDNKSSLYADDSSFYTAGNTVAEIETNLKQDLNQKLQIGAQETGCLSTKLKRNLWFCAQDRKEYI